MHLVAATTSQHQCPTAASGQRLLFLNSADDEEEEDWGGGGCITPATFRKTEMAVSRGKLKWLCKPYCIRGEMKWLHKPHCLGGGEETEKLHNPCHLGVSKVERNGSGYITHAVLRSPNWGSVAQRSRPSGTILDPEAPPTFGGGGGGWVALSCLNQDSCELFV